CHSSGTRVVFHTTTLANVPSILRHGVRPEFSTGARRESWLTTAALRGWACAHVKRRHRTPHVVCLRLLVARDALTRRARGIRPTARPVPPSAILSVGIAELVRPEGDAA